MFFWRAGVHISRDQGVKHLGGKGMELIDGYNNEAVKGAGALAFHYTFFVVKGRGVCVSVCCVPCAMVFFSLKKKNI